MFSQKRNSTPPDRYGNKNLEGKKTGEFSKTDHIMNKDSTSGETQMSQRRIKRKKMSIVGILR